MNGYTYENEEDTARAEEMDEVNFMIAQDDNSVVVWPDVWDHLLNR